MFMCVRECHDDTVLLQMHGRRFLERVYGSVGHHGHAVPVAAVESSVDPQPRKTVGSIRGW